MKTSTITNKIIAIIFWGVLWQILSTIISQDILLPSPIDVSVSMVDILADSYSYVVLFNTFSRICIGFILGVIFGSLLAIIARKSNFLFDLMKPMVDAVKVTPVASFIILALAWVSSQNLSIVISFLMIFPIFFLNIYYSFENVDKKLLQMAKIYKFSFIKKLIYIYLPSIMPQIISSVVLASSLGLKSAVAAEVIAFSNASVGNMLQEAKSMLEMADVLSWTIILIVFSVIFEKAFVFCLKKMQDIIYKRGIRL